MIKKQWEYSGEVYSSEKQVRQAIWEKERKAFGTPGDAEAWAELGVTCSEVAVEEPEVTVDPYRLKIPIRNLRDSLLSASDYYMLPDYPSTEEGLEAVKAYRQALRDVPKQENYPYEVIWPEKPSVLIRVSDD